MKTANLYTNHKHRVHHFDGRELGYELRGKTTAQRAALAAHYSADGFKIDLHSLTAKQVAALFRISVPTLDSAKALTLAERAAVFFRLAPLVNPTRKLERDIAAVGIDRAFSALERVMDNGVNGNGASAS